MKKWNSPELVSLDMEKTAHGTRHATSWEEVRVDQNGNYWFSYSAGSTVSPTPTAEVEVKGAYADGTTK